MRTLTALLLLCLTAAAPAEVVTSIVNYTDDDVILEGFLAHEEKVDAPRPGVLICHQWMGLSDHERTVAKQLAELGYIAFALDIYGTEERPSNRSEASARSGYYKNNPDELRRRARLGLEQLRQLPQVRETKIAVIGYCFGGTTGLELARDGADVQGVVSFHGGLSTPRPAGPGDITAKLLICHGAVDPYVPDEEVATFMSEMNEAGADYQFIAYADAVHSFTHTELSTDNSQGAAYNEKAHRRSWLHMQVFFHELFEPRGPADRPVTVSPPTT